MLSDLSVARGRAFLFSCVGNIVILKAAVMHILLSRLTAQALQRGQFLGDGVCSFRLPKYSCCLPRVEMRLAVFLVGGSQTP